MNRRRRRSAGAGKVDEFALFRGKLHSPCVSPLAARLPCAFEVLASRLCILAERKEVEVICKSNGNKASVVPKLGIETSSVEEEKDRGERRSLRHACFNTVRRRRLAVEVQASCTVLEEATAGTELYYKTN